MDAAGVGSGESAIGGTTRTKVEAVLEKIGPPLDQPVHSWPQQVCGP